MKINLFLFFFIQVLNYVYIQKTINESTKILSLKSGFMNFIV